jgi:CRISPR/Cas system-associated exonuclease Cas4 (RecB family)
MSDYYKPVRTRNLYNPNSPTPFKVSRSKIELFMECPRCFYIDRRLGTGRPPGFPFNLNSAVDELLKKEFDSYRLRGEKHPLINKFNVDAIPIPHAELDKWRANFTGIQYLHQPTNLLIFGAIDDLWQDSHGNYIVVDYKATSKNESITELNKAWQISYKRQMEIYQWLLRMNEYQVSDTGYFVYCNGDRSKADFNASLEFEINLIPYTGNDNWVEQTIYDIHTCLNHDEIPESGQGCDYCAYVDTVRNLQ